MCSWRKLIILHRFVNSEDFFYPTCGIEKEKD